ncbi:MAG: NAD-dependent epimerase/dehydratase family protein [Flavobacteriales bacterium]|nr:NAD-dependent epimerase/dehydratase family protein [Flavobacteriales bacterium]
MKVVLFGATGFSGKAILKEALLKQHQVTILVRNKSAINLDAENLTVVEGNVLDKNTVAEVLKNCDAVIQCLGVGGKGNGKPTTFISDATKIIVEEMEKQQIKRLIAMSNVGAGNSISFQPWFFTKIILPYFMKWLNVLIDDKNRMEPIIMNSELDWTIVRCPNIVDKPAKGTCNATLDGKGLKLSITLPDLSKFMVDQLKQTAFIKQAPSVSN